MYFHKLNSQLQECNLFIYPKKIIHQSFAMLFKITYKHILKMICCPCLVQEEVLFSWSLLARYDQYTQTGYVPRKSIGPETTQNNNYKALYSFWDRKFLQSNFWLVYNYVIIIHMQSISIDIQSYFHCFSILICFFMT